MLAPAHQTSQRALDCEQCMHAPRVGVGSAKLCSFTCSHRSLSKRAADDDASLGADVAVVRDRQPIRVKFARRESRRRESGSARSQEDVLPVYLFHSCVCSMSRSAFMPYSDTTITTTTAVLPQWPGSDHEPASIHSNATCVAPRAARISRSHSPSHRRTDCQRRDQRQAAGGRALTPQIAEKSRDAARYSRSTLATRTVGIEWTVCRLQRGAW